MFLEKEVNQADKSVELITLCKGWSQVELDMPRLLPGSAPLQISNGLEGLALVV